MNYLKEKKKKVIGLTRDELGEKIVTKCVELRAKTNSYLIDKNNEYKKAKGTKMYVIKRKIKFENHENCLETAQFENKISYLGKKINIVLKKS